MNNQNEQDNGGTEAPLVSHLTELRDRLVIGLLGVAVFFIPLAFFANEVYSALAAPLLAHLPQGGTLQAIDPAAPFLIPFKVVIMLSVFLAVPVLLYQLWAFIAPGLYKHEKRLIGPLVFSSTCLFFLGVAFAYFAVFPLIFGFFAATAPEGVTYSPDIGSYLDFVIMIFFAFGVAFEVPIAVFILISLGLTTPETLSKQRPYFVLGAFVIGAFLTPPDIISQTLLALPMWFLFEAGIFFSKIMLKDKLTEQAKQQESNDLDEEDEDVINRNNS